MMVKKLLILIAVFPVLALFAYALTRDPRSVPSPLIEREAPAFSLKLFNGTTFTLAEHRGKVMVMNVWSSWCIPACYNEAPALEAAWQRYRTRDVRVAYKHVGEITLEILVRQIERLLNKVGETS